MLKPGSTIGRYRIVSCIGAGGMSDVYRVRDTELGTELALKLLLPEFARDPARASRFYQEIRAAESLQHPNIVALRDVAEAEGYYFYTMDLLPGGSLKSRIQDGMSPEQALQVMFDLSSALIHAHQQGFIHRDIKPGNILFRDDGTALLSDFGIVKVVGRSTVDTRTGMSIGTPHYMSPEQASGKKISHASDLYSLGIVFYEMLTGQVPFDAEESIAVALKHLREQPRPLPANLRRFQPVINKLLAKSENKRFANAAALQEAIVKLQTPQPLQATQRSKHVPRAGFQRSIWAAGGGLLAVLVMITLFAVMNEETSRLPPTSDNEKVASLPLERIQDQPVVAPAGETALQPDDPGTSAAAQPIAARPEQPSNSEPAEVTEKKLASHHPISPSTPQPEPRTSHLAPRTQKPSTRNSQPATRNPQPATRDPQPETTPAQGRGAVQVVTTPASATVWLDGVKQPGVTPLTISGIAAGTHRLRVHKDEYRDIEDMIEIKHDMKLLDEMVLQGRELIQLGDATIPPEKGAGIAQEAQNKTSGEVMPETPQASGEKTWQKEERRMQTKDDDTDGNTGEVESAGKDQPRPKQQKIPIVW
ncbi:MAG: serine/threonine protein kinase [Desulfobulbaceae bacterium]